MQSKFSYKKPKKNHKEGGGGGERRGVQCSDPYLPLSYHTTSENNNHFVNYSYGVPDCIDSQGFLPICTWNLSPQTLEH